MIESRGLVIRRVIDGEHRRYPPRTTPPKRPGNETDGRAWFGAARPADRRARIADPPGAMGAALAEDARSRGLRFDVSTIFIPGVGGDSRVLEGAIVT